MNDRTRTAIVAVATVLIPMSLLAQKTTARF